MPDLFAVSRLLVFAGPVLCCLLAFVLNAEYSYDADDHDKIYADDPDNGHDCYCDDNADDKTIILLSNGVSRDSVFGHNVVH